MRQVEGKKPNPLAPHRVAWNAYLLVDDAVHSRIESAAKKAEKRLGVGRKTLVYGSVAAGGLATTAALSSQPVFAALTATFFGLSLFPLSNLVNKAMEFRASPGALAEDEVRHAVNMVFKVARLPLLASGLWNAACGLLSHSSASLATGTFLTSFGVAAYLVTSSTGMLDKARQFLSSLKERLAIGAPEPQTLTIPVPR